MSYINYINSFWFEHEKQSFSTTEIALYFYLLKTANFCGWKPTFQRNNSKICGDLRVQDRMKGQYSIIGFNQKSFR